MICLFFGVVDIDFTDNDHWNYLHVYKVYKVIYITLYELYSL